MGTEGRETKPFGVAEIDLRARIDPEILPLFGVSRDANPEELGLALVELFGNSYGGGTHWTLDAKSADLARSYGSYDLVSDDGQAISPDSVLDAASDWIRQSPTSEWVPGSAFKLPLPQEYEPYFVRGIILVRASEVKAE